MLKIRLRREGARNSPFFRVVVSDSRRTPTGPNVETIGFYDPKTNPPTVRLDVAAYDAWLEKGAMPSATVKSIARQPEVRATTDEG